MSTVTDELLLRIAVVGGAVAAAEVAAFDERIAAAGGTAEGFGKKMKGVTNALFSFKGMIVGLGIATAIKQFTDFQRQMEMLHTQTGATQAEVTRATKAVLGMAVAVGTGPNSLAQALYHIESTQVRGKQAYEEMRIAAEGAQVGQANLVDVTNALNAVLVGKLIPTTGGFSAAMGQLNATVGSGDMYMQDLASAFSTGILSSMKAVGLKLIDINAAMATLGDNNIRGTQAANRLRMGLLQVVKPTNAAANELHALGMTTYQLAEDYYKPRGLLIMLQDLHSHLDGLSKVKQNDVLMTLFGRGRMSAGIMTLYEQMSRLSSKYDAINKGQTDFNNAWQATTQTLGFAIDQLKAIGEVWLIKIGQGLSDVVKWFREMGPMQKSIIDIALAFGTVLVAINAAKLAAAAFDLIASANPWVLAITAITAVVIALINHFGGLKKVVGDVATFFSHAWQNAGAAIINVASTVIGFINKLINGYNSVVGKIPIFGGDMKIAPIPTGGSYQGMVQTSPGHYTPLYELQGPGSQRFLDRPPGYQSQSPTPYSPPPMYPAVSPYEAQVQSMMHGGLDVHVYLDGKEMTRAVVRQGLMATARRGVGGSTISNP